MSLIDRIFPPKGPAAAPANASVVGGPPPIPGAPAATAPTGASAIATQPPEAVTLPPGGGAAVVPTDLLERRKALAEELASMQWDLGGLTYEMAIRDHFRLEVLIRHAARLQEVDAQLGELERLLRMEESGAAGGCPRCGALHSRGAVFCWQCGTQLLATTPAPTPVHRNGQGGSH
jgi:hypothetical protein